MQPLPADAPPWVADPTVVWNILLHARLTTPPTVDTLTTRLRRIYLEQRWPHDPPAVALGPLTDLLPAFAGAEGPHPGQLGLDGAELLIGARHQHVDGLGLLGVLSAVTGEPVVSDVRGLGDRPAAGSATGAVVRRLGEVAFRPPARIAQSGSQAADLDTFSLHVVPRTVRTSELVHAAVRGLVTYNSAREAGTRRVAIAVGASRRGGESPDIADRSALLRLRNLERASIDEIRALMQHAPVQHSSSHGRAVGAPLTRLTLRVLAPRLGSTMLVSHLGTVTAGGVDRVSFYPVTGGGSGVSLGAVTLDGATTITLRGRGRQHNEAGLEELLDAICDALST